jgi:putative ABC transport system permease protein
MLNIDVTDWSVPRSLLGKELIFAVAVPLLAMAVPILRATRISPRKAIQDPGIVAPRGPIALTSRLIKMPGNRRWSFALRNSFRRPWRLALTLLALAAGGAGQSWPRYRGATANGRTGGATRDHCARSA